MPRIRTSEVFVPGKLPAYTYNARDELFLERSLEDYVEEAGKILTLAGPTKTGKTVLLRKVLDAPVWLDGQGITGVGELWRRVVDELGSFDTEEVSEDNATTGEGSGGFGVNLGPLSGNIGAGAGFSRGTGARASAARALNVVGRDALLAAGRPLVIDDFHFIERDVQREVVRALKPLVLAGLPIVFVSISHRVREVVTAEADMTGRVSTLSIDFWSQEDLLVIAQKGFEYLNVQDPLELASKLAEQSYGSPHLMQQFCRELCKLNGVREEAESPVALQAPESWPEFFKAQVDLSSEDWALRFLRGPQERGSSRTQYPSVLGVNLDGYGLCLMAIARSGPKLSLSKDELRAGIAALVTTDSAPGGPQTTSFLK
ncbi:hypothetical protein [uncultured Microbacterium sp.]|uniref:hypothetical protein n=1 Tax=uncultured Microbacterium sp. TaxID=191216 RepID=UPI0025D46283|nr:hypothetical protein [uncultured Microbacterium sp.]